MQTYTGVEFYPLDPHPEDIRLEDISAALSKICRYGGHCIRFYSVAEHCVHVASKAPDHLKLEALMHDASEGYLMDMVRPLKMCMPEYRAVEEKVERAIAHRFNLPYPHDSEVKRLDNAILMDERQQNMGTPPRPWRDHGGPLGVTLRYWNPAEASCEFTTAFYRYGGRA